jgi:hypothetical protein
MASNEQAVEQAIRASHCAKTPGAEHPCVGSLLVTPTGIELKCSLCGNDSQSPHPFIQKGVLRRCEAIFAAAGIPFSKLSLDVQTDVAREVSRLICPGCGRESSVLAKENCLCECGWWFGYKGWQPPKDRASRPPEVTADLLEGIG